MCYTVKSTETFEKEFLRNIETKKNGYRRW
jgi:hypothetical protein